MDKAFDRHGDGRRLVEKADKDGLAPLLDQVMEAPICRNPRGNALNCAKSPRSPAAGAFRSSENALSALTPGQARSDA
jgi:hypothetical protein